MRKDTHLVTMLIVPMLFISLNMIGQSKVYDPYWKGWVPAPLKVPDGPKIITAPRYSGKSTNSNPGSYSTSKSTSDEVHAIPPPESGYGSFYYEYAKYTGHFENYKRNGYGVLMAAKDTLYAGEWKDDLYHGKGISFEGGRYEGYFVNGKKEGLGKYVSKYGRLVYDGAWKDDKKSGYGSLSENGDKYTGYFVNDLKDGQGSLTFANGDTYTGQFAKDLIDGYGTYTWPNGLKYEGNFTNGYLNGSGKKYIPGKPVQEGTWFYGEYLTDMKPHTMANGGTYYGELKDGKRSGQGIIVYANKSIYKGNFANDLANGHGVYSYGDGLKYDGYWRDDNREGSGTQKYKNGTYVGNFKNNLRSGHGTYTDLDGDVWEGEWLEDKLTGEGIYTDINGDKYAGHFYQGLRDGKGTLMRANGNKVEGDWVKGKIDGFAVLSKKDGSKYEGEWVAGRFSGHGVYTDTAGGKYMGDFQNSDFNGHGVYIFADGSKYDGEWKDGKRNGQGSSYAPNGRPSDHGEWKDDIYLDTENSALTDLRKIVESASHRFRDMRGDVLSTEKFKNFPTAKTYSSKISIIDYGQATVKKVSIADFGDIVIFDEVMEFSDLKERARFEQNLKIILSDFGPINSYGTYSLKANPKVLLGITKGDDNTLGISVRLKN